jgi:hypothetical protein
MRKVLFAFTGLPSIDYEGLANSNYRDKIRDLKGYFLLNVQVTEVLSEKSIK